MRTYQVKFISAVVIFFFSSMIWAEKFKLSVKPPQQFSVPVQAVAPVKGMASTTAVVPKADKSLEKIKQKAVPPVSVTKQPVKSTSSIQPLHQINSPVAGINVIPAAGKHAKAIGENAARLKQIQQIQNMQNLGSPLDQAKQGVNGAGDQDCPRSSNPAACLRNNMNSTNRPDQPGNNRRSIQTCLQAGGNPADCMNRGNKGGFAGAGRIGSGPGSPADGLKIPGQGQARQDGGDSHGSVQWEPPTATRHPNGDTKTTRMGYYEDGAYVETTRTTDRNGNEVSTTRTLRDHNGIIIDHSETETFNFGHGESTTNVHENEGTDRERHWTTHTPPENSQPTPEGSNGLADNCDWNPAFGRCMKSKPDPKGMTSQPGADGESPGGQPPASATPHIGSDAVTNTGGGDWSTRERRGFGLNNGGKPLDMKDPGPGKPK